MIVLVIILCILNSVYSYPPGWPLEKTKVELLTAGISPESVDGLLEIASKYPFPRYSDDPIADKNEARDEYDIFMSELDYYIWARSSEDLNHYLNDFISIQRKNRVAEKRLATRVLCKANQTNVPGCVP